ncbi:unnamed protein product [Microthlaspi erraticum]|uniref:Uncharacterized protein n=1 Tax=Microthlaspi erraticum TaxID=1685480 RepID=A0A6D2K642_9BRAS|nr:unnamed protein product [Microthlaspi erraticum]
MASTFPRSILLTTQGDSLPKSLTEPHHLSQGKKETTRREEEEFQGRRSNSTTGLDRVQTEETQLDRADGRVDLEEPYSRILDLSTIQHLTRTIPEHGTLYGSSSEPSSTKAKEPHTLQGRRRGATSSIERRSASGVLLMAVSLSRPRPCLPVLWGH